ncbi:hypothetical protein Nepgr_008383 [Nepenthes gracilis]|uniref:Uncharacterized protein n=1 Tax=Nepenthes gracilis TaxID=150966 RepID=A0AAD3S8N1_NEPGR|nr:hypothetical protein Nepgr_008383 [Nepenthes gracilis]
MACARGSEEKSSRRTRGNGTSISSSTPPCVVFVRCLTAFHGHLYPSLSQEVWRALLEVLNGIRISACCRSSRVLDSALRQITASPVKEPGTPQRVRCRCPYSLLDLIQY